MLVAPLASGWGAGLEPGLSQNASFAGAREKPEFDSVAFATVVLRCFVWGFTNVATRLAAPDISPVMQSGLRSILATVLLVSWARFRNTLLFGVTMGALVLSEPLRPAFLGALAMVGAGIWLVNAKR